MSSASRALVHLLAWLACVAAGCVLAAAATAGSPAGGLPVWSELSAFEQATMRDVPRARAGDADALLALYLVAAGDVRDETTFHRRRDEIDRWLAGLRLDAARSPRASAQKLLAAMHDRFFLPVDAAAAGAIPPGYAEEQSRLSQVFATSTFNCMSSAQLYIVLASKLGLETNAAIIPSHVYVQVRLPGGEPVDIETTMREGFAVREDPAFFSPEYAERFRSLGLEPPDPADYAAPRLVSTVELAAVNMWDQHVAPEQMAAADRMRLVELRAELVPAYIEAQANRLTLYHREFARLSKQSDYAALARMYASIAPYLQGLRQQARPELADQLVAIEAERALSVLNGGDPAQALAMAQALLQTQPAAARPPGESTVFTVVDAYIAQMLQQRQFAAARASLAGIEPRCLANAVCANSLARVHAEWAQAAWEAHDWSTVAVTCRDYLRLDGASKVAGQFRANLEGAYLNWSSELLADEEWEQARTHLQECQQALGTSPRCRAALEKLTERYGND
jgi:hypothetical protein